MTDAAALADIRRQLMWTRLAAVVEEQARTLMLTAFSPTVREAGDLSAGLFDRRGRMVAQAVTGTPGHVNSMAEAVPHFLARFPLDGMKPGDHFVTNDPWLASGHLHDVTVVSPVFRDGRAIALFACTCHQVDIGGMGQGPDGRSVYEEGFYIPIMPLARGGTVGADLMTLLRANVRQPDQVEGDVLSYIAANETAARRLNRMLDEFGAADIDGLADWIVAKSRAAMLAEIAKLPRGTWRNELTLDGYDKRVTLRAALSVSERGIALDFAGTDRASPRGINVVLNYCKAYASFGVRCVVGPRIPNNAGSLAPISVSAPEGSVLNVKPPAPVSARHIIGQFLPDLVLGCLAQILPERVPAEGAACLWGAQLRGGPDAGGGGNDQPGEPFDLIFFNSGGSGARPFADGMSATAFPSGVRAMSSEMVEAVAPVVIWRKELRPDSGGDGTHRGGLGQIIEIEPAPGHEFDFSAMFDRVGHAAKGRDGGQSGAPGSVALDDGTKLKPKGWQHVPAGRRLVLQLPGGGGYGDPDARDPKARENDLSKGYVTK